MRLLFDYVKQDGETMHLLQESAIFFIPVINVDGFDAIGQEYMKE